MHDPWAETPNAGFACPVRIQPHGGCALESECAVAVELQFVRPFGASRKFFHGQGEHRLDEMSLHLWVVGGFHSSGVFESLTKRQPIKTMKIPATVQVSSAPNDAGTKTTLTSKTSPTAIYILPAVFFWFLKSLANPPFNQPKAPPVEEAVEQARSEHCANQSARANLKPTAPSSRTLQSSRGPSRFQSRRSTSTLPADTAVTDGARRQTFGRLKLSGG